MSKKIIAILLCLVLVLSFAGCQSETTYKSNAVAGGPTSAVNVENNGSNVVFADGYAYYINASMPYYGLNVYGEVELGTINRMDLATGEVVTVQSKLVADQYATGISIFGDKIYYTSPSDTLDRDGKVQNKYLDIMVCDLNGGNTQKLYTFATARSVTFIEDGGVVYAIFEDSNEIKAIDLSKETPKSQVIASEYKAGTSSSEGIFILRSEGFYDELFSVSASGEEKLVLSGKTSETEKHTITILGVKNGKIYYSLKDSVVKQNTVTYVANLDGSNAEKITALTVSTGVFEYGNGYIFKSGDDVFYAENGKFTLLAEKGADSIMVSDGYLFTYAFDSETYTAELYKLDIQAKIADAEVEAVLMFEDSEDTIWQSSFPAIAFGGGKGFYFSGTADNGEMFAFDVDGVSSENVSE